MTSLELNVYPVYEKLYLPLYNSINQRQQMSVPGVFVCFGYLKKNRDACVPTCQKVTLPDSMEKYTFYARSLFYILR